MPINQRGPATADETNEIDEEFCRTAGSDMWDCYTPTYQIGVYRQTGDFDRCDLQMRRWWVCMRLKIMDPSLDKAQALREETKPHRNSVFKYRPGHAD